MFSESPTRKEELSSVAPFFCLRRTLRRAFPYALNPSVTFGSLQLIEKNVGEPASGVFQAVSGEEDDDQNNEKDANVVHTDMLSKCKDPVEFGLIE